MSDLGTIRGQCGLERLLARSLFPCHVAGLLGWAAVLLVWVPGSLGVLLVAADPLRWPIRSDIAKVDARPYVHCSTSRVRSTYLGPMAPRAAGPQGVLGPWVPTALQDLNLKQVTAFLFWKSFWNLCYCVGLCSSGLRAA